VSVPADSDPLRFPLPVPEPAEIAAPIASAPPLSTQPQPVQQIVAPALQQPTNLQLASYTARVSSVSPLPANVSPTSQPAQASSPWRPPQIAQVAPGTSGTAQPLAATVYAATPATLPAPPTMQQATVAATLRAVDSPPQPGDPMPRVRMPNYVASQASADGFRPRTSMQY
jgi:hypothetical protein